ncbi:MAG: hypothetical protein WBE26_00030 [Phycisphaerae bacterium]
MMNTQTIVDILNELLALEQGSLASHLPEMTVFVSRLSVEGLNTVQRMARASEEHGALLAGAILQLNGVPGPRIADAQWADLHYQELHHVLPRLVVDREALIRKYTLAAAQADSEPRAAELISRILEHHQEELASLRQHE